MCENTIQPSYIYLLQEREFIRTKENIFKVGQTEKENHVRFKQYPKGSLLLFQIICNDCKTTEKNVIKKFKEEFTQRKDIGKEYFEGDYKRMINIIYLTIQEEGEREEEKEAAEEDDNFNSQNSESRDIEITRSKEYQEEAFQKVCDTIRNKIQECHKEKIFNKDLFVSFVHERIKVNFTSRVSVAVLIESYKSFLSVCNEICILPDKKQKILGLLRRLGFGVIRSSHKYYIENAEIVSL